MTSPKILVALLGTPTNVEQTAIRRRVDEILLVFADEQNEQAEYLLNKFSSLGISIVPVCVVPTNFSNILSSILRALDNQALDNYQVEFVVMPDNCIMTIAASVAAAIVNGSILCPDVNESLHINEIWPSELVNLTFKKREILTYLENYSNPVRQKDISLETGISQSGVSRHTHDLELAGYVVRSRIARKKQVQITELGSTVLHYKQIRKRRVWGSYFAQTSMGLQTAG
jgi:predicted transcriptional regulator